MVELQYGALRIGPARFAVAALRYCAPAPEVAAAVQETFGLTVPRTLEARCSEDRTRLLAWRSPTETLCLSRGAPGTAELAARLSAEAQCCVIELTDGLSVLRLQGPGSSQLLSRLGGTAANVPPGCTHRVRLADVPAQTIGVSADETLLVVERLYRGHVLAWIGATLLDFAAAGSELPAL